MFPKRKSLAQTPKAADLDRYRGLRRQGEEELEAAEEGQDSSDPLYGARLSRARALAAEMEFCRSENDVRRTREAVDKRSYWGDAIAVDRIHL